MDTTTDMRHMAADARCARRPSAPYREKLERYGFVVLEPDGTEPGGTGEPDGTEPVPLADLMAPLGAQVSYGFGTRLIQEQRPGTDNSQFRTGAIPMHVDGHLNAEAVDYVGLECLEAPYEGGETLVASSRAFFAAAPDDLVARLRTLEVEYWSRVSGFYAERPGGNPVVAPVQVDPVTGEDTLWVGLDHPHDPTRNFGAAVRGRTQEESLALFAELDRLLRLPEVMYAHTWRVGQVLIMDNRRVVHARAAYPVDARRKILRISVG
ncbi:TauD/TfdA family dioxygenase [Streptomyces sp. NPDC052114]|uniref:TauD/TfdA dioxygenase family protein n=1 Tax=unclassified Streptomyces TaxID=2593676 RepID=UPI003429AB82